MSNPAPPLPLAAYTGAYANDSFGEITLTEAGDGLELRIGPTLVVHRLTHWNRDTFTYIPFPEPPAPAFGVTFLIGPDGAGMGVTLEDIAGDPGRLARVSGQPMGSRGGGYASTGRDEPEPAVQELTRRVEMPGVRSMSWARC